MAKRLGDFNQAYSKKQKTDLDDLWGDDLDVDEVDNCFQLASQICEQEILQTQKRDLSLLSFTTFKNINTKRTFTSTQSNPELNGSLNVPSTSKNGFNTSNGVIHNAKNNENCRMDNGIKRKYHFDDNGDLNTETKLQKITSMYLDKEGEATLLRSQLRDIKYQMDKDHMKREKDWTEKHATVTKQLNAIKSELEFKNLEIANLKHQLIEKIKAVNRDSVLSLTQSSFFKQPNNVERSTQPVKGVTNAGLSTSEVKKQSITDKDFTINYTSENFYPLQHLIDTSIFHTCDEEKYSAYFNGLKMYGSTVPFLQDQLSQELTDKLILMQPRKIVLSNGKKFGIDYIHTDIFNLMKCTAQELETRESCAYINRIVCTSEQLIDNLYKFLLELEKGFVTDNSGKVDMLYLKNNFNATNPTNSLFSSEELSDNEMGKSARQTIACIAHILPYSGYLRQYLLENKHLIFKGDEDYLKFLPVAQSKLQSDYSNNYYYLNLILSIVNISGKLKNSHIISGFISAVCLLLNKIYSCNYSEELHPLITRLTREIVFVCPNVQVLCYLSEFFNNAALHSVFVNDLCTLSSKGGLKIDQKEKIVYYKQDVCVLQVFCVLVEYGSSKIKDSKVLELNMTILVFIANCFKLNPQWTYYQEDKHCVCLCKIVKLYIDILYQVVEEYKKRYSVIVSLKNDDSGELSVLTELLVNGIEILKIFNFKVYDIIVKYISIYSQYKVIIKTLISLKKALGLTETHMEKLHDLIDDEETPLLDNNMTDSCLWN